MKPSPSRLQRRKAPIRLTCCWFCGLWILLSQSNVSNNVFFSVGAAKTTSGSGSSSTSSTSSSSSSSSSTSSKRLTKRVKNLDYLNADTLRYYMSPSTKEENFDVAVLFYAQWCKNCHALAPIWDQISQILKAGTTESKLIVGLFDCEANEEHMDLCSAARVTHYPTMAFISLAGDKHYLSRTAPRHMVHYTASNWQLGEAILDWIRAMSGLARWHRAGWKSWIRRMALLGGGGGGTSRGTKPYKVKKQQQPPATAASSSSSGKMTMDNTKTAAMEDASLSLPIGVPPSVANELELAQLRQKENQTRALLVRSSTFVDTMLFPILKNITLPVATPTTSTNRMGFGKSATSAAATPSLPISLVRSDGGKNYTDVYAMLHYQKAWTSTLAVDEILRTCVSEVSLDYCSRVNTRIVDVFLDTWPIDQKLTDASLANLTVLLSDMVEQTEPFCIKMDNCTLSNFADVTCQPAECPFVDPVACRYLTACLMPQIQVEYAEALAMYPVQQQQQQQQAVGNTGKPQKNAKDKKQQPPPPAKKSDGGLKWGL